MKQQLTVHLDPALADYARGESARLGVSLSSLIERLLVLALESEMGERTYRMAEAGVTAAIDRAIQRQANRLAHLTAHTAINAGIAAELAVALIAQATSPEQARALRDQARYRAAKQLKEKLNVMETEHPKGIQDSR